MAFAKTPAGILTKAEYETPIGQLKFHDGLPDDATIQKVGCVFRGLNVRVTEAWCPCNPLAPLQSHVPLAVDANHPASLVQG